MTTPNQPRFTPTEYVSTKDGNIALLNGDNYGIWAVSMKKALSAASCLLICTGGEVAPPANAARDVKASFETRTRVALRILNSSIPETFYDTISEAAEAQNPIGIWEACKEFDRSSDPLFCDCTREAFDRLKFDPKEHTIRQFVNKLTQYQLELKESADPITNSAILTRLLSSLPLDPQWIQAKTFCQYGNYALEKSITLLQVTERNMAPSKAANLAQQEKEARAGRSSAKRRHSNSRSQSPSLSRKQKCYFCKRKGHVQANCKKYKKAQKKAQEEGSSGSEISVSENDDKEPKSRLPAKDKMVQKNKEEESTTLAWHVVPRFHEDDGSI